MVNYYVYARDCSFSTFNNEYYHTSGLRTLEQFKRDVINIKEEQLTEGETMTESKIIYLHWGDDCWEVTEDETKIAYLEQNCEQMGTEPEWIIRFLKKKYILDDNDKIKLLYIITDGLISHESAKKCSRLNEYMHYETIVFHAFNEDSQKIDLSVAASFFKSRCMVYRNYKLYVSTDISKEFGYDKINIHNFIAKKDQLKSYLTLKFINGFEQDAVAMEEVAKLKSLRERLLDDLLLRTASSKNIKVNVERNNSNILLSKYVDNFNNDRDDAIYIMKINIQKTISALINYIISDEKSYSFDTLTFDTEYNEPVEEKPIDNVIEEEVDIFDFILEDDVGVSCGNRILVDAT